MNKYRKAILIGMCLGDGSVKKVFTIKNGIKTQSLAAEFSVTHGIKQKPYMEYKAVLLGKQLNQKPPNINYYTSQTEYGLIDYCKMSKYHRYFRAIRKWLYPNDKKTISRFILNKLNPEAIAIWYMDDGGVSKKKNKYCFSVEMRISTYFSEDEADVFIEYFREVWGIEAKKRFSKKTQTFYMAFNNTESVKLELLIGKYIIPSMQYKLPSYYNPRALDTLIGDDIV